MHDPVERVEFVNRVEPLSRKEHVPALRRIPQAELRAATAHDRGQVLLLESDEGSREDVSVAGPQRDLELYRRAPRLDVLCCRGEKTR